MNCPKCGAKVAADRPSITIFACGSECDKYPPAFYETNQCLRNQLATVTAERDAVRESHDRLLKIAEELVGGADEYWAETEGAGIVRMAHEAIEKGKDA